MSPWNIIGDGHSVVKHRHDLWTRPSVHTFPSPPPDYKNFLSTDSHKVGAIYLAK